MVLTIPYIFFSNYHTIYRCIITFILVLGFGLSAIGQQPDYYFKNYQVNNGLSSNTVTTILQDKKGFMWFGTRNGLNRFDGASFKVFQNKPNVKTSLGNNSVLSLYEDKLENLWVGTYKGIYIYHTISNQFKRFNKIPEVEIRSIAADAEGKLWIIADQHLYKYDPTNEKLVSFALKNELAVTLHIDKKGQVWIVTSAGILKRYHSKTNSFESYSIQNVFGKSISTVNSVYAINDNLVVIGTIRYILLFDLAKKQILDIGEINRQPTIHVHTILAQTANELWLGTEEGLCIFNLSNHKIRLVSKQPNDPYSITDNIVSSLYKDREGGIWIGTYFGGINYYSKQFNNFHKYYPSESSNTISGNLIHEICKDDKGNLWIGTEDAGISKLNLTTEKFSNFMPGKGKGSIAYRNIHGLAVDGNWLWIGTLEHGLDVMDINTGKVIKHYDAGPANNQLKSDFIVSIYRTKNGDVLIGTWNGLFRYNRKTDDFWPFRHLTSHIQTIHEDKNGTLWVGTYGDGLHFFDPKNNRYGRITAKTLNNYVNNLYQDKKGLLWLCTENGLYKLDIAHKRLYYFSTENGLPANQVFRILEDDNGMFWISTSKGLSNYNPINNTFHNFHTTHGLPTEQFNYNSSFKDASGQLFFGTVKGLISFKPSNFFTNSYVPPVYITSLQVNNVDYEIKKGISTLFQKEITLPYDSANLSLDVAALSYVNPEMNGYQYLMEGLEKHWTNLANNRRIFYPKLPPGDYTFKLKGSNSEGKWNSKLTTIKIKINPPWWATTVAYFVYGSIIMAIIATIFVYYRKALNEKSKRMIETMERTKEREIYSAKIDFFTNVAHEIRTPLTLIKLPLDKLLQQKEDTSMLVENLAMIKKNTNRLIDLTNQLLDFRKAEANKMSLNFVKTDINELLNDVFITFKPAADQKNLTYQLQIPKITLFAYVDTDALKKIITNLINNAIKYSENSVSIRLLPFSSEDDVFKIEFRNNGPLIAEELREKIFEPFYRLEHHKPVQGTGIGLPLAKSLAELHKGKLSLEKSLAQENIFLLALPIHQDYEMDLQGPNTSSDLQDDYPRNREEQLEDKKRPAVLIVEDNKDILNYIGKELNDDFTIFKAANGVEAIGILENNSIQLVISDIMMPLMDGVELCKRMKANLDFSHIPIILLTAKTALNSKIEGLEAGADAYIEKPFAFEHLSAQINNLLTNRTILKEYIAKSPLSHIKGIAHSKTDVDFIENLNKIIYDNITDIDFKVDQLSEMMNMSKPTLYRKIKALSNLSPNELINLTRLKKAAELLAANEYKINEVANIVGYSMASNFSRDFQKQFGLSPSNYLAKLKGD